MRILAIPVSLLALALCAGCAQMRSGTGAMGAGAGPSTATVMCRDGAWVSNTSQCGSHMGVERVMTPSSQR